MSFRKKIYQELCKVPVGTVVTYKILAERIGSKAYRAVGIAMKYNKNAPGVPCHRVVSSTGMVGNYSGKCGMKRKINLLRAEEITIKKGKIIDFKEKLDLV